MENNNKVMQKLLEAAEPEQISMFSTDIGMLDINMPDPIYHEGDIIDIKPSRNGLPNRLQISGIILRVAPGGAAWVYKCIIESDHSEKELEERIISSMKINMTAPVYRNDIIKQRYEEGWRFVGTYPYKSSVTADKCEKLRHNLLLKHARMCEAYNSSGRLSTSGQMVSIWIMYKNPINGSISPSNTSSIDVMLK